jgi:hypothetical protein
VARPLPSAGYSGKSLPDKLGFKPGMSVLFVALPGPLAALARSVDFVGAETRERWSAVSGTARFDAIHAFTTSHAEIAKNLARLQKAIKRDGMIWVSWPKKSAKVLTDVTEDVIRAEALKLDLVDVKVAAVDEVWSGLKLVIRKERR